jgi:hypothetical protein
MAQAINKSFPTTPGQRIAFKVQVGDGQIGSSLVTLPDRQPIRRRDCFELDLGLGENLAGKKLLCTTVVTDIRDETDSTSVEMEVTDGLISVSDQRSEDAAEPGGMVSYAIVVRFK